MAKQSLDKSVKSNLLLTGLRTIFLVLAYAVHFLPIHKHGYVFL